MIDWNKKPPVVKILGKEEFLKKREIDRAKKGLPNFDFQEFRIGTDDISIIRPEIEENGLFSSEQVVVLYNADRLKPHDWLEEYIENPLEDKVLVLVEKEKGRSLKWFKNLSASETESFSKIKPWDLPDWMVKESDCNGFDLSKPLAQAIQQNVGHDLYELNNELQKMYLYASPNTKITPKVVKKVLFSGQGFSVFDVFEDWFSGDTDKALKRLANFYEYQSTDPTMKILGAGLSQIETLLQMKSLLDQGTTFEQQKAQMGGSPYILKTKTRPHAEGFTMDHLLDIYDAFCTAERRYKTGKEGYDLIQQIFIEHRRDI